MSKLSGLQEIRSVFSAYGWEINGIENEAAELWFHGDYVGLLARGNNGHWRCTHNMIHSRKDDDQYIHDSPVRACRAWVGRCHNAATVAELDRMLTLPQVS